MLIIVLNSLNVTGILAPSFSPPREAKTDEHHHNRPRDSVSPGGIYRHLGQKTGLPQTVE